jgi:hypothetical protein
MITKEQFIKFITEYKNFEEAIDRIDQAVSGRSWGLNLFECDWYNSVGIMLDTFLDSHFTNNGCDLVTWWLFEDVDKLITQKVDPDLFNGESEIEYDVEDIEALWDYIQKYKNDYLLND